MIKDYLGTPINIGDKGLRVHSYNHTKEFKRITVLEIAKDGKSVGILTEGNTKIGWTFPERILVQGSIKVVL